jgi:hypothetical protein
MSLALRQPSFAILLILAWLVASVQLFLIYWMGTAETLLDTDDALRLVQMREFLAGRDWFDLRETRVQPPLGYESIWSRLIDAGLAGLFLLFQLFTGDALAERLMRTVWPLLWLLPAIGGVAAIAWRLAGRQAALVVLVLAAAGLPALQQFRPGRVDHHNVQIALAVLTLAAVVWSDRLRWTAWAAGALTGLALAIGIESIPYFATFAAALAARFVADRTAAAVVRAFGLSLAAATLMAFLVSVGPDQWARTRCDVIAINLVAPIIAGGLLLALATGRFADRGVMPRGMLVAAAGGIALALFGIIEPRCFAGPLAMIDPSIRPIWLDHVAELQPLIAFARLAPIQAASLVAFPIVTLLSVVALAWDPALRRDFGFLTVGAAFAVAFAVAFAAIRAEAYTMWFGMPLVAAIALRLFALLNLSTLSARLVVCLLLTPTVLSAGAIGLAHATRLQTTAESRLNQTACFKTSNYATLSRLPSGLIAAEIDLGPFLLASTPHSVLAGPYHPLSSGIIAAHRAFAAPPDEARRLLERLQVTYVVTCGSRPPLNLTQAERDASLWHRLQTSTPPEWLKPVQETQGQPLLAFRIK